MNNHLLVVSAVVFLSACANKDPGPVTYKTGVEAWSGAYDGTKALAYGTDDRTTVFVPRDCPAFACAHVKSGANLDNDALKKACPKGQFLIVQIDGKAAAGSKGKLESVVHTELEKGGANGLSIDDTSVVEVLSAGPSIVARVHGTGSETVEGIAGATVCPKP